MSTPPISEDEASPKFTRLRRCGKSEHKITLKDSVEELGKASAPIYQVDSDSDKENKDEDEELTVPIPTPPPFVPSPFFVDPLECWSTPQGKRSAPEEARRMLLEEEAEEEEEPDRAEPPVKKAAAIPEDEEDPGAEVENKRNMYARWCFTWFPGDSVYRPAGLLEKMEYLIFQEEQTKSEKLHLQGYFRCSERLRWSALKKILDPLMPGVHLRWARKPEIACIRYCSKKESRLKDPVEFGKKDVKAGQQGRRSDLEEVAGALKAGKSYEETVKEFPEHALKFSKGMKEVASVFAQEKWEYQEREKLIVVVLWGETDVGKTHRVRLQEGKNLYTVEDGRDPWGSYNYQEAVLFDEFGMGDKWPINKMKRLLDRFPMQLDCRYANKWAAWKRVYILSQDPPSTWYMTTPGPDKRAFWRRVTKIYEIKMRSDDPKYDEHKHEIECENPPKFIGAS